LEDFLAQRPGFMDGSLLLAEIYLQQGARPQAEALLKQALQLETLSPQDRSQVEAMLQRLSKP
jgi:cytochrome c-type biogenesis protein CcmH/NrfG